MRFSAAQQNTITENRERLLGAFKDLRKQGIIARANFMCCGGCAAGAIAEKLGTGRGQKVGGVYWHNQDEKGIHRNGGLHLGFGSLEGDESSERALGEKVVGLLQAHGIKTEWDGNPTRRIWVDLANTPN